MLFQSNSIKELKENISVYEKIRVTSKYSNKSSDSKFSNVKTEKSLNEKTAVTQKCFKCGDKSHFARDYSSKHLFQMSSSLGIFQ